MTVTAVRPQFRPPALADTSQLSDVIRWYNQRLTDAAQSIPNLATDLFPTLSGEQGVKDQSYPYGDARRYGLVANGVADDTTALQSAITAAQNGIAGIAAVVLPAGTISVPRLSLNITSPLGIFGAGMRRTTLLLGSTSQVGLNITSALGPHIHDLAIQAAPGVTSGACIRLNGPNAGVDCSDAIIERVLFASPWIGVDHVAASGATIRGCRFNGVQFAGAQVDNTNNPDSGDSIISECNFAGSSVIGSQAIRYVASSGLRIENNKFQNYPIAINVVIRDNRPNDSGQLWITGCSIETCTIANIQFSRQTAFGAFGGVTIADNFFNVNGGIGISVLADVNSSLWLFTVGIAGNQFSLFSSGTGVSMLAGTDFTIADNDMTGNAGTTKGIVTGAGLFNTFVGPNHLVGLTTPYQLGTIPDPWVLGNQQNLVGLGTNGLTQRNLIGVDGSDVVRVGQNQTTRVDTLVIGATTPVADSVVFGAADSGGAGFRMLRIPN